MDLLVAANPADISDINSPKVARDTPRPSKTQKTNETKDAKKNEQVQDVDSRSVRIASITLDEEGNNEDLEEVE